MYTEESTSTMSKLETPVNKADHVKGNLLAPIELVEYGDYQCVHCGLAYPIIKRIEKALGRNLKFIFRNFPLAESHPLAVNAAVAAEAASLQNKFWEMHDKLFEEQHDLEDVSLVRYAAELGMDIVKFKQDFEKPSILEKVEKDFEGGDKSNVDGVPTFFVNGEKYNGSWQEDEFLVFLEGLLK